MGSCVSDPVFGRDGCKDGNFERGALGVHGSFRHARDNLRMTWSRILNKYCSRLDQRNAKKVQKYYKQGKINFIYTKKLSYHVMSMI